MTETMIARRRGSVLEVVINDPASRNALSLPFYAGLREALAGAEGDASVGAVVLTGAGSFFSSGGNLNRLKQRTTLPLEERRAGIEEHLHATVRAVRACPKPVIAAVEGGAAGAGMSLVFACDLVVSARDARFTIAYVKVGLTPDGGVTASLGQALPRQLLCELAMTGAPISAERLFGFGLINALTEPGAAVDEARRIAQALAAGPARALAAIKALCRDVRTNGFDEQLAREATAMAEALGGDEGREGIDAFLEKRMPDFAKLRG